MTSIIRNELLTDYRTCEEITREAFWNKHLPGCDEHFLLHRMRSHPDFIRELAFVAEIDGQVVGHIAYTKSCIQQPDGAKAQTVTFGPVSVHPKLQKQGIGEALIRHSLEEARRLGFVAVLIMGDPRYYHKFGFRCAEAFDITTREGKYAVALMALPLKPNSLQGGGSFFDSPLFEMNAEGFAEYEATFPPKVWEVTESQKEFQIIASLVYDKR